MMRDAVATGGVGDPPSSVAAFFDVDGTLVDATIVHYYVFFRRRRMSRVGGAVWYAGFLIKCGYYLLLDRIDRNKLNVVFYRNYAGLPVKQTKADAVACHDEVVRFRRFAEGPRCVEEHQRQGHRIVLVTGSLGFVVAPLAVELNAFAVLAPTLLEHDGRFTGELDGPENAGVRRHERNRPS